MTINWMLLKKLRMQTKKFLTKKKESCQLLKPLLVVTYMLLLRQPSRLENHLHLVILKVRLQLCRQQEIVLLGRLDQILDYQEYK